VDERIGCESVRVGLLLALTKSLFGVSLTIIFVWLLELICGP
jgi:hypothetical protein